MWIDLVSTDFRLVDKVRLVILIRSLDTPSREEVSREVEVFLILRQGVKSEHGEFELGVTGAASELIWTRSNMFAYAIDILSNFSFARYKEPNIAFRSPRS